MCTFEFPGARNFGPSHPSGPTPMTHTRPKNGLAKIGLAKIGFGQNWSGENQDGQKWMGQMGLAKVGLFSTMPFFFAAVDFVLSSLRLGVFSWNCGPHQRARLGFLGYFVRAPGGQSARFHTTTCPGWSMAATRGHKTTRRPARENIKTKMRWKDKRASATHGQFGNIEGLSKIDLWRRIHDETVATDDAKKQKNVVSRPVLCAVDFIAGECWCCGFDEFKTDFSHTPKHTLHSAPFLCTPFEEYALKSILLFTSFLSNLHFSGICSEKVSESNPISHVFVFLSTPFQLCARTLLPQTQTPRHLHPEHQNTETPKPTKNPPPL